MRSPPRFPHLVPILRGIFCSNAQVAPKWRRADCLAACFIVMLHPAGALAQDAVDGEASPTEDTQPAEFPAQSPPSGTKRLPADDPPATPDPRLLPPPSFDDEDNPSVDGTPLTLTIGTGYALRFHEDERNHGAMGRLALDVPLWWGFGLRGEGFTQAWGPSPRATRPLVLSQGALSLLYRVDEGPITGILGVGAALGGGFDIAPEGLAQLDIGNPEQAGVYGGALFSVGLRFRLGATTHLELLAQLPVMLLEPEGVFVRAPFGTDGGGRFPFQPSFSVGLTIAPVPFLRGVLDGVPLWALVAPSEFDSLLEIFAW